MAFAWRITRLLMEIRKRKHLLGCFVVILLVPIISLFGWQIILRAQRVESAAKGILFSQFISFCTFNTTPSSFQCKKFLEEKPDTSVLCDKLPNVFNINFFTNSSFRQSIYGSCWLIANSEWFVVLTRSNEVLGIRWCLQFRSQSGELTQQYALGPERLLIAKQGEQRYFWKNVAHGADKH